MSPGTQAEPGREFAPDCWAVILGASSGFGLATAQRLSEHGMNLCLVHRDRRGALARIEPEFEKLRASGVQVLSHNVDALAPNKREAILDSIAEAGASGHVRVLLHSIAFGNLKLIAPLRPEARPGIPELATKLGVDEATLRGAVNELFEEGIDSLVSLAALPDYPQRSFIDEEDLARTIHSMGTSLLGWTQRLHERGFFASDARVFGLTSEGNTVAWRGYAAVAAAKVALEAVARSIAVEFAPFGIRANVIQAGITDTPALRAIPGNSQLKAQARARNPFARLTTPHDVADAIYLLARDEAAWINGEVIRVDGGEHISGAMR